MFGGSTPFANIRRFTKAPIRSMRTFQLDQPIATHYRRGTCAEVDCPDMASGWRMGFDLTDPARRAAARWIRDHSGRTYTAEVLPDGSKVIFTFAAGQECLKTHRVPLERDPFMIVRPGDWRGNPDRHRVVRHRNPDDFIDHWSTDLDRLQTIRERG